MNPDVKAARPIRSSIVAVRLCAATTVVLFAGVAGCGGKPEVTMDSIVSDIDSSDSIAEPDDGLPADVSNDGTDADTIVETVCAGDTDCTGAKQRCNQSAGVCVECLEDSDCHGAGFCQEDFVCRATLCQPSARFCVSNVAKVCSRDGGTLSETNCSLDGRICSDGTCYDCLPLLGECLSDSVARRCRADGSGWDEENCDAGLVCANGDCLTCVPGQTVCSGATDVVECILDGSGFVHLLDCWEQNAGEVCQAGRCVDLCDQKTANPTNEGCSFVAVDMEQFRDNEPPYYGDSAPYAVVVANGHATLTATVDVFRGATQIKSVEVPAAQSTVIELDALNIFGVGISDKVYRIESNLPVVAYQFNPLENVDVFSNDASLLLPTDKLGSRYRVVSMPNLGLNEIGQYLGSNFAVVAVEPGDTEVTITPTANVPAGENTVGLKKGVTDTWTIQQGEVFNVSAEMTQFLDLTGSLIEADRKIAVFSGHVCAVAPVSTCVDGTCSYDKTISCTTAASCPIISACDHIEEQLQPVGSWGTEYVIPKTMARGIAPDLVRLVANEDGTRVTITPPVAGSKVLSEGEFYEFEIDQSVVVKSDKRFVSALILEGEAAPGSDHTFCSSAEG